MAPELSVIVPTHNRRALLRACLGSLERQIAPFDAFEVVVVVDGSTDGTVEMLRGLETPFRLRIVEQAQAGQSAAINAGAARAEGRVLLMMDDDEEASETHVRAHLEAHNGGEERIVGIGVIGGRLPPRPDRLLALRAEAAREHWSGLPEREPTFNDCYGGNFSVPVALFREIGGFAEDLPRETDFDIAFRLHRAGARFVFVGDSLVTQSLTTDWRAILRDGERRGEIAVTLYERHPPLLESMPLGGEAYRSRAFLLARALALALKLPPEFLGRVGFLLPRARAHAWFQFMWSYCYWRGVKSVADRDLWRRLRTGTVILTYHAFGAPGEEPSTYVVPARRFARQMAWLSKRGYNVLSLTEYVRCRHEHVLPPPRSVVLTIDDGYVDNDTLARPILERHRFSATLFMITSHDGRDPADTDPALAGRPLLSVGEAATISGGTLELGAHTRTHPDLTALPDDAAEAEIAGSKRDLEEILGEPVRAFSYPFGESSAGVREAVRNAGFECACGITRGHNRPTTDLFNLRRINVSGRDSLLRFAATLIVGDTRLGRR